MKHQTFKLDIEKSTIQRKSRPINKKIKETHTQYVVNIKKKHIYTHKNIHRPNHNTTEAQHFRTPLLKPDTPNTNPRISRTKNRH